MFFIYFKQFKIRNLIALATQSKSQYELITTSIISHTWLSKRFLNNNAENYMTAAITADAQLKEHPNWKLSEQP